MGTSPESCLTSIGPLYVFRYRSLCNEEPGLITFDSRLSAAGNLYSGKPLPPHLLPSHLKLIIICFHSLVQLFGRKKALGNLEKSRTVVPV